MKMPIWTTINTKTTPAAALVSSTMNNVVDKERAYFIRAYFITIVVLVLVTVPYNVGNSTRYGAGTSQPSASEATTMAIKNAAIAKTASDGGHENYGGDFHHRSGDDFGISDVQVPLLQVPPYYDFPQLVKELNLVQLFRPSFEPGDYSWCDRVTTQPYDGLYNRSQAGIHLNRVPKAASTSAGSVTLTIARRVAMRKFHLMTKRQVATSSQETPRLQIDFNATVSSNYKTNKSNNSNDDDNIDNNIVITNGNGNGVLTTNLTTADMITSRLLRSVHSRVHSHIKMCPTRNDHMQKPGLVRKIFGHRSKQTSFLYGIVRDPMQRAISRICFLAARLSSGRIKQCKLRRHLFEYKTTHHQMVAVTPGKGGFQVSYLSLNPIKKKWKCWNATSPNDVKNVDLIHQQVASILKDYDFIMLVERFNECLVLLKIMLGLEFGDILYSSSKGAGGYFYMRNGLCIKLPKPKRTLPPDGGQTGPLAGLKQDVQDYLQSKEWYARSYGDYLLHEAINQSLDYTIEQLPIGKDRFQQEVLKFEQFLKEAQTACQNKTFYPCNPTTGIPQLHLSESNCYGEDFGCGYECLDEFAALHEPAK